MPTSLDAWLAADNLTIMTAPQRAVLEWRRIQDRPTSVTVVRNGVVQAAQTVRVEADNTSSRDQAGNLVTRAVQRVTLFGIRQHATLPDTNIRKGDRFTLATQPGATFEVVALLTPPGELQCLCDSTQGS